MNAKMRLEAHLLLAVRSFTLKVKRNIENMIRDSLPKASLLSQLGFIEISRKR